MIHDLLHYLGIDTQQSYFYDFWSGVGTQIALVLAGFGLFRRNNCKKHGCLRLGHYELSDPDSGVTRKLCWKHHPGVSRKHVTVKHLEEIFHRHKNR